MKTANTIVISTLITALLIAYSGRIISLAINTGIDIGEVIQNHER